MITLMLTAGSLAMADFPDGITTPNGDIIGSDGQYYMKTPNGDYIGGGQHYTHTPNGDYIGSDGSYYTHTPNGDYIGSDGRYYTQTPNGSYSGGAASSGGSGYAGGGSDYSREHDSDYSAAERRQRQNPCYCGMAHGYCSVFRLGEPTAYQSVRSSTCGPADCEKFFATVIRDRCESLWANWPRTYR